MRLLTAATLFAIFGCTGLFTVEGANPGECADDADNDGDGLFDCDDTDCVGASVCAEPIGDSSADADADTDTDTDTDADPTFDVAWNSSGMTLSIDGGSGGYTLGMAETGVGADGWYGEDCLDGMSGYVICHDDVSKSGISLDTVTRPGDVEANSTTLFAEAYEANITYMVGNDAGDCWTWGDDTSYYTSTLDCAKY